MQLYTLPSKSSPPPDGLSVHVLLVGGNDNDLRAMRDKLKPRGIGVGWQWATKSSGHREFPRCDAVIIFTKSVAHSLFYDVTSRAKTAGVPIIPHSAWPKTLEALANAGIGTAPPKPPEPTLVETPAPPPEPVSTRERGFQVDTAIVETHDAWNKLPAELREAIRQVARDADQLGNQPIPQEVRDYLHTFGGNPRGFLTTLLLATPGDNITQSACIRVYKAVLGKKAESSLVNTIGKKVQEWCGPEYGLRKGEPFTFKKHTPPAPQEPEVAAPVPTPTATVPDTRPPASNTLVRTRFERVLHALLDAGESCSVRKDGASFVLGFTDGTALRVEGQTA